MGIAIYEMRDCFGLFCKFGGGSRLMPAGCDVGAGVDATPAGAAPSSRFAKATGLSMGITRRSTIATD